MKPHKWAAEIKAWADGAVIQWRYRSAPDWYDYDYAQWPNMTPSWQSSDLEFRVKPKKKEPGQVLVEAVFPSANWDTLMNKPFYNKAALTVINAYKAGEIE